MKKKGNAEHRWAFKEQNNIVCVFVADHAWMS